MADLPGYFSDTELYYETPEGNTGRISYIELCQVGAVTVPVTLPLCGETAADDEKRGGWLEALLVDIGAESVGQGRTRIPPPILTASVHGATGTTNYSYAVSMLTATGETVWSNVVTLSDSLPVEDHTSENYNQLNWTAPPGWEAVYTAQAIAFRVGGRNADPPIQYIDMMNNGGTWVNPEYSYRDDQDHDIEKPPPAPAEGTAYLDEAPRPTASLTILTQPYAAPTGLSGTLHTTGGTSVPGSTVYYAIAALYPDGELSELSNVVGPFSVTNGTSRVALTWTAVPGSPSQIRVYRGLQPDFGQFNRYRLSGLPYSFNGLPGSATSLDDIYIGYSTGEGPPDGEDPHWDLDYRRQKYYAVSAIYADGSVSPCSDWQMAYLAPRNYTMTVRVSWTPPSGALPAAIAGYRVRRLSQHYHFPIGPPDRQWDVGATTLSIDDDALEAVTAATECPQTSEATASLCDGGLPKYLLAGHTLKKINQVFVYKPVTTTEGAGEEATQTTTDQWVLLTEGTDYWPVVCERNGNRYHILVFNELQRNNENCQFYRVTANVEGVETNGDGTGTLLTNFDDIFEHIMLNIIFNTYRSSIGLYAPPMGTPYFTDVPYAPGLFNRASIISAKAVAASRVAGGYVGAGALTTLIPARQLIHDLLVTGDLELYQYQGPWYVRRPDSGNIVRGSLTDITPATGILRDTFEPVIQQGWHFNMLPYFAGPLSSSGTEGFLLSGEEYDDVSIDFYGRTIISEPVYLLWTRHPATAYDVIRRYVVRSAYPPITATFAGPVRWYNLRVGDYVNVTHPSGLGADGWVDKACKVLAVDLDLDTMTTSIMVQDVDYEVP